MATSFRVMGEVFCEWAVPGLNRGPSDFQSDEPLPQTLRNTLGFVGFYHISDNLQGFTFHARISEEVRNFRAMRGTARKIVP